MPGPQDLYTILIEDLFHQRYVAAIDHVDFTRQDIEEAIERLNIRRPRNLGDILYTFRYRRELPASIRSKAPRGKSWVIMPAGTGRYSFLATAYANITPNPQLAETKIPDATPGMIALYALSDEQALLARLRYNRLIDVFTGVAAYSLQSHLRTNVRDVGQIETDEVYVGVDQVGAHFVFPVQAKGGSDRLSIVQIAQDFELCSARFPNLIPRPIAAQFMDHNVIALFELVREGVDIRIRTEEHYRLVPPSDLEPGDLEDYRSRVRETPHRH